MRLVCVVGPPRAALAQIPRSPLEASLREIDDEILDLLGGSWRRPPAVEDGWEESDDLAELRRRASGVLGRGDEVLVWEDPRVALTLPFWDRVATVAATVVCVTCPDDAVRDLVADEGLEVDEASELWLRYLVAAWRGAPTPVPVTTGELREDPQPVIARVRELAGDGLDEDDLRAAIARGSLAADDPDRLAPPRTVGQVIGGPTLDLARAVRRLVADEHGRRDERVGAVLDALHEHWLLEERAADAERSARVATGALEDERERVRALQERVQRLEEDLRDAERRWAGTARAATAREDVLAKENQRLRGEVRRLEQRAEEVVRAHDQLRSRRSVRAAVVLAGIIRPLVDRLRGLKGWIAGVVRGRRARPPEGKEPTARVYAVVLNYRHTEDTLACLRALAASNVKTQYPVVVDNGSGEEAVARLRSGIGPRPLIDAGDNLGYAAGNNLGIRYALERGAEFVWILNPDAEPEPDALAHMLRVMDENPDAGIVGARILNGGSSPLTIATDGGIVDWSAGGATDHRNVGARDRDVPADGPAAVDYVPGVCMLVRRAVFDDVGLMPEEWFLYFEETDFNLRVQEAGWRTLVEPAARVHHRKRSSGRLPSPYYVYYFVRNRLLFALRHGDGCEERLPPDLERWIEAWAAKVDRADPEWRPTYDKLVEIALADARAGTTGRRRDVEDATPGGQR